MLQAADDRRPRRGMDLRDHHRPRQQRRRAVLARRHLGVPRCGRAHGDGQAAVPHRHRPAIRPARSRRGRRRRRPTRRATDATLLIGRGGLLGGARWRGTSVCRAVGPGSTGRSAPARARRQLVDLARTTLDAADAAVDPSIGAPAPASSAPRRRPRTRVRAPAGAPADRAGARATGTTDSCSPARPARSTPAGPNPATERSVPTPISQYGTAKLAQEDIVAEWTPSTAADAAIARTVEPLRTGPEPGQAAGADLSPRAGLAARSSR